MKLVGPGGVNSSGVEVVILGFGISVVIQIESFVVEVTETVKPAAFTAVQENRIVPQTPLASFHISGGSRHDPP